MAGNQLTIKLRGFFLFMMLLPTILWIGFPETGYAAAAFSNRTSQSGCTREWYDPYAVAASVVEMDYWDLQDALDQGQSIADVAAERDVAVQVVIDALVEIETGLVRNLERGGCLTATEADTWIARLPDQMRAFVDVVEAADSSNIIFLPILIN